jgi:hypothetical protein
MIPVDLHAIKIYLLPFDADGVYVSSWIDITKYVSGIGNISISIDSSDYQLGVYKNSNVSMQVNNNSGKFSDVNITTSFFKYRRGGSKVKINYDIHEYTPLCGLAECGNFFLGEEVTLFEGLLSDESYKLNAKDEIINFNMLGYEWLFSQVDVPYASILGSEGIEELLYMFLNQTTITNILTVVPGNISVGVDQDPDDYTLFENQTVDEALETLLLVSNSVLRIQDNTVYISERTAGATSQKTFYGQGSTDGAENIINLNNYNNGFHRTFNYFTWKDTTAKSYDADSVAKWNVKKKEVDTSIYTGVVKQENFLDALLAEFKDPKTEFQIVVPLSYDTIALNLLDKVNVDYPVPYVPFSPGDEMPICGVAVCGVAILPTGLWAMNINKTTNFKIIEKNYDLKKLEITLKLREV